MNAHEPRGVAGMISPWNSPLVLTARALGPALAAGCTAAVKMPGHTGLTNGLLAEAVAATGRRRGPPPGSPRRARAGAAVSRGAPGPGSPGPTRRSGRAPGRSPGGARRAEVGAHGAEELADEVAHRAAGRRGVDPPRASHASSIAA